MSVVAKLRRRAGALLSPDVRRFNATRRDLAERYLAGDGIEIGALHRPLVVPRKARVRFVDREDVAALRRHYPELRPRLVPVDIVDDGETLATLPDASVDFVIANHFIEHTQSPLATLRSHLRVLRPGGMLYLRRPGQPPHVRHFARGDPAGAHPARSRGGLPSGRASSISASGRSTSTRQPTSMPSAAKLMADDYSIHFHVWTPEAFEELLHHARDALGLPFEIAELRPNQHEFIAVLRRRA